MAVLLHVLVILAVLFIRFKPPQTPIVSQTPPGIAVEFDDSGSSKQTTVPPKTQHGPPQQAQAMPLPPPPAPASAPVVTSSQPNMQDEVQIPDMPLSALPSPPPKPHPRESRPHAARPHESRQEQKYVLLNGMSYGSAAPMAQSASKAPRGMNFALPMSNAQAAMGADFSIKGDAGAGWDAALRKWVEEHAYYPQAAAEQNQQGTATVEFTVDRQGHVTGMRLLGSSGSPFLDQAWIQLFVDNRLPPFPADAKNDHVTVRYTVHYQLIQ